MFPAAAARRTGQPTDCRKRGVNRSAARSGRMEVFREQSRPPPSSTMPNDAKTPPEGAHVTNFIRQHIERDLAEGKYAQRHWGGKPGPAETHARAPLDPA